MELLCLLQKEKDKRPIETKEKDNLKKKNIINCNKQAVLLLK